MDTIIMDIWTNFSQGFFEYSMNAYNNLEPWTYPLIFMGIIGYIYMATHSIITAIIGIIVTFAIYAFTTNIFVETSELSLFLFLITLIGITMLITALILKVVNRI